MSAYRIYVQYPGQPITPPHDVELTSDDAAMSHAIGLLRDGGWVEVWEGTRFLSRVGNMQGDRGWL